MTVLTGIPQCAIVLALATLEAFAQAGTPRTVSKPSNPTPIDDSMNGLIKTFAGSWAIHLSSDGFHGEGNGSAGNGEEIWRAGPGSNSLIEEYHSTGTEGEIAGLGIFWREESARDSRCSGATTPLPLPAGPCTIRLIGREADWFYPRRNTRKARSTSPRKSSPSIPPILFHRRCRKGSPRVA